MPEPTGTPYHHFIPTPTPFISVLPTPGVPGCAPANVRVMEMSASGLWFCVVFAASLVVALYRLMKERR